MLGFTCFFIYFYDCFYGFKAVLRVFCNTLLDTQTKITFIRGVESQQRRDLSCRGLFPLQKFVRYFMSNKKPVSQQPEKPFTKEQFFRIFKMYLLVIIPAFLCPYNFRVFQ